MWGSLTRWSRCCVVGRVASPRDEVVGHLIGSRYSTVTTSFLGRARHSTTISWPELVPRSDQLDDRRDAHAAADAERGEAALLVATGELVDEGAEDHRAGGAEGVAHRDGPAVDVGDVVADAQVAHEAHRDGGERLVDLEEVDVLDLEAGLGERLAGGGCRTGEHDRG